MGERTGIRSSGSSCRHAHPIKRSKPTRHPHRVRNSGVTVNHETLTTHPWAWWAWAMGAAATVSLTNNPLLIALIAGAVILVVVNRRTDDPWARSAGTYLKLAGIIIVIRMVFIIFFGANRTGTVLFTLPSLTLPDWAAGIALGGPVALEAIVGTGYEALRLATMLACFGAANSLANPRRALKSVPAALHDISTAVVVALSVFPQIIVSVGRVRRARRLRGGRVTGYRAVNSIVIPVLEDAVESSMFLARGMESRGYGRTRDNRRVRPGTGALLVVSLMLLTIAIYFILANPSGYLAPDPATCGPGTLCAALFGNRFGQRIGILAALVSLIGVTIGLRSSGRRLGVSRYRPDPWTTRSILAALCGLFALAVTVGLSRYAPTVLTIGTVPLTWPVLHPVMLIIAAIVAAPGFFTQRPLRNPHTVDDARELRKDTE
mgnify:FL=1